MARHAHPPALRRRPAVAWRSVRAGRLAAVGASAALALAGCAPDAWQPGPQSSAYLNQIERVCGTTRLGELTISQLMNPGSSLYSAYFVDMTSRYELNRITTDDYVSGIASTFNTGRESAGIRCIIAQKKP